jgi:hypothetical protein
MVQVKHYYKVNHALHPDGVIEMLYYVIKSLTTYLKEYVIQALLREFYGFVQMIVVKTFLIDLDLVMQLKCRTHSCFRL